MSKRNNKGFTLVELIIAMSILSIVLALGYKVITGSEKVTKNQMEVFSEQQNANLINKYLTKDLEQVRKFTTADTGLNPYTYILNDGVQDAEKIKYEVEKTTDGKFYTVTRKTSSSSIELISNYPTNSQVPFSISLVENTENLFKVSLNGKSEVSKYEFEVSSRVQNNVALVDTPITEGGFTPQPPQSSTPEQPEQKPPQSSTTPSEPQPVISGEVRFNYKNTSGNHTDVSIIAKSLKDGVEYPKDSKPEETGTKTLSKVRSYKIQVDIPIKSDNLKILLSSKSGTSYTPIWEKTGDKDKWNIFKNEINNNKIYIYGENVTIQNIKINGADKAEYTFDIKNDQTNAKVEVEFLIADKNKQEGFITIGFGEFSTTNTNK